MDMEIDDLKQELNVADEPDIYFLKGNFKAFYREEETLGEGTSGTVKKCVDLRTDEKFAVKIVMYKNDAEMLHSVKNQTH